MSKINSQNLSLPQIFNSIDTYNPGKGKLGVNKDGNAVLLEGNSVRRFESRESKQNNQALRFALKLHISDELTKIGDNIKKNTDTNETGAQLINKSVRSKIDDVLKSIDLNSTSFTKQNKSSDITFSEISAAKNILSQAKNELLKQFVSDEFTQLLVKSNVNYVKNDSYSPAETLALTMGISAEHNDYDLNPKKSTNSPSEVKSEPLPTEVSPSHVQLSEHEIEALKFGISVDDPKLSNLDTRAPTFGN